MRNTLIRRGHMTVAATAATAPGSGSGDSGRPAARWRQARAVRTLSILLAALGLTFLSSGVANASIYWYGVNIYQNAYGGCLEEIGLTAGSTPKLDYACDYRQYPIWDLVSAVPDRNGNANVVIENDHTGMCIAVTGGRGTGPYGSDAVTMQPCFNGPNGLWANQVWTMITERTASGSTHYIGFYNAFSGTCLDGGEGVFAYYELVCSGEDNYQVWNIGH
jgi:hypothetical protein